MRNVQWSQNLIIKKKNPIFQNGNKISLFIQIKYPIKPKNIPSTKTTAKRKLNSPSPNINPMLAPPPIIKINQALLKSFLTNCPPLKKRISGIKRNPKPPKDIFNILG